MPSLALTGGNVRVVSGGAWNPSMLPGLVAWYDASDLGSITESGGLVSQWDSKVGSYHLTQGTGGNQPTTGADTQGGRNVLTFNAEEDRRLSRSTTPVLPATPHLFIVCSFYSVTTFTQQRWFSATGYVGDMAFARGLASGTDTQLWMYGSGAVVSNPGAGPVATALYSCQWGAGGSASMRKNGASVGTGSVVGDGVSSSGIVVGGSSAAGAGGLLGEILYFAAPLPTADRDAVESYLNAKWAVY